MGFSLKIIQLGPVTTNCYLLMDDETKDLVVIDPAWDGELIVEAVDEMGGKLKEVWLTHAHFDHLGGLTDLKKGIDSDFDIGLHPEEKLLYENKGGASYFGLEIDDCPEATKWIADSDFVNVGEYKFQAFHTPGHTTGHLVFYCESESILFSGDLIFQGSIGRTDLPGGSFDQIIRSIKNKVFSLPDDTIIYSGHGPASNVGFERKNNPFLK